MPLVNSAAQLFLVFILFGFFEPSIENAAFAFLGGSFVTALVLAFQFNRFDTEQEKTSVKGERLWLHNTRIAYGLSLMILVGSLAMKSDVFTVYYLLGAEESSSYSLASRFREMLMIAGGIFTFVWQPRAVINTRNDTHENNSLVVWYAVFGTALLSILAVFLIALLGVFNAIQESVETMVLFALFIPGVCVAVAFSMTRATDIARAKWRNLAEASFLYFFCSFACVYVGAISQGAIGAAAGFSAGGIAFVAIYFGLKNLSLKRTSSKQH
jgi:O-antigen/teichoic acid export membrane protein